MHTLFDDDDFAFLSRQPGFDLHLYRKLRKERLRIFRQYLKRVVSDYDRLHKSARLLVAEDHDEHSDVLAELIRLKLIFSWTVLRARSNYLLCCFGYRTLAVRALIVRLEDLSTQLSAIATRQIA